MLRSEVTISVVIPCYNVEDYVGDAVESALQQTRPPLEIICVDDGSSDNTLGVLHRLEAHYPGSITILSGPNKGASNARNQGLVSAKGDYIQFLDADDLLHEQKLAYQADVIQSTSYVLDLVVGDYIKQYFDGSTQLKRAGYSDPWVALLRSQLGITSSNLWCRSSLLDVGGWNESLASSQEAELMFRLLQQDCRVAYDGAGGLTTIRQRSGSISNSRHGENWKRYIELRSAMLNFLSSHDMVTPEREKAAFQALFVAIRSLYQHDSISSMTLYNRFIPKRYKPLPSASSRLYLFLFHMLGFERTERLRALFRTLR